MIQRSHGLGLLYYSSNVHCTASAECQRAIQQQNQTNEHSKVGVGGTV